MIDLFELKSAITGFTNTLLHAIDTQEKQRHISLLCDHAVKYLDKPYIWAGNDPLYGSDCSGFICYMMRSHGLLEASKDYTADMLMQKYPKANMPKPGALVFYGKGGAGHVMLCLSNRLCIGAQGGSSNTKTVSQAVELAARIKILPIRYRIDIIQYSYPFDLIV